MDFQESVRTCLTTKYATWDVRGSRPEYWYFFLFNFIVSAVMGILDLILGTRIPGLIVSLALLVPGICAGIRRLHDTNRTGWWLLIGIIPIVGWIVIIIFLAQPGDAGPNGYGPPPTGTAAAGVPPPYPQSS